MAPSSRRAGAIVLTGLAAGAFAAAWHLQLWLAVLAGLSAAVTLAHDELSGRKWRSSALVITSTPVAKPARSTVPRTAAVV